MIKKIVVFSDTHQIHRQIKMPSADILIFAGDAGIDGTKEELEEFVAWLEELPYDHKICVGGNHDEYLEDHPEIFVGTGIHFLWDRLIEIDGIKIYGSPWRIVTEERMYQTEKRIAAYKSGTRKPGKGGDGRAAFMTTETWAEYIWREIPASLDILVTHQPPLGIMDFDGKKGHGSRALLEAVCSRQICYHVFGHVHPGHGVVNNDSTIFVNAAICANYEYSPEHKPIIFEINK